MTSKFVVIIYFVRTKYCNHISSFRTKYGRTKFDMTGLLFSIVWHRDTKCQWQVYLPLAFRPFQFNFSTDSIFSTLHLKMKIYFWNCMTTLYRNIHATRAVAGLA